LIILVVFVIGGVIGWWAGMVLGYYLGFKDYNFLKWRIKI